MASSSSSSERSVVTIICFIKYGPYRYVWDEVVPKYLDCGSYENGFARIQCPTCKEEMILPLSCKTKLCPSCEQKRVLLFAEKMTGEILLPVPHRFWTFSIPKVLRGILLRDRRLLKLLPACAFKAVQKTMENALPESAVNKGRLGAVLAIHTAGSLLQWNPHVH
ncbi:MAG: transposase zinc-binding domain-containing protein, partial [Planctomycetota bacterium]